MSFCLQSKGDHPMAFETAETTPPGDGEALGDDGDGDGDEPVTADAAAETGDDTAAATGDVTGASGDDSAGAGPTPPEP